MSQALKFKIAGSPFSPTYVRDRLSRRSGAVGAASFAQISGSDSKSTGKLDNRFDNMDKAMHKNPEDKNGDVMWDSFGQGYATRSEEEGFGCIYGRNDSEGSKLGDCVIHESDPDYDKTQGCRVADKAKANHQSKADT
ncbi:hypothetical protein Ancab_025846 [Ancistrocladus abbreviatus]